MKQLLSLTLLLLSLTGCTTFKEMQSGVLHRYDAKRKLAAAVQADGNGRSTTAIAILEQLIAEPGVKGVTDEALFRLSLLKLPYEEKEGSLPSSRYLERLRSEYRDSAWSLQAKPLLEFLKNVADMKKHDRNLIRDNKELRQNIERLKALDMQLERKPRPEPAGQR